MGLVRLSRRLEKCRGRRSSGVVDGSLFLFDCVWWMRGSGGAV